MNDIAKEIQKLSDDFGIDRKRSIGEVAKELGVETHVIRFWEEKFPQIQPQEGRGGRRYYYNKQIKILKRIKKFLHEEGYTIMGLQKLLKKRKSDSYKEEDLDIIISGQQNQAFEADEMEAKEDILEKNFDDKVIKQFNHLALNKERKEELASLLQNVTNNIGNLKTLLKT